MSKRFFISYSRRSADDEYLARYLESGLKAAGHEVFIDVGMTVGTDWSTEIDRRILWCDALIVLLSEKSVHSEMVQGEVRRAHHKGRAIFPIRMRFEGPLDYELDSYLGRLQYVLWTHEQDSAGVLSAILEGSHSASIRNRPISVVSGADLARPLPSVDPRVLTEPGGTLHPDAFYIRRQADNAIDSFAQQRGRTVVIKGPRQTGKSSLLIRYLHACRKKGKSIVFVDFQRFPNSTLREYPVFLTELAIELIDQLGMTSGDEPPVFPRQQKFIRFVEERLLADCNGAIVLAFDEADRILGTPWQGDFFAMLRSWHNYRAFEPALWGKVDLALVVATEPYLLIERADQSPFNVVPATELSPFSPNDLDSLNTAYGEPLAPFELDQLYSMLGGQPFLTRLAFWRLVTEPGLPFENLIETASADDGPFGDHLRAKLLALQRNSGLFSAFQKLIKHGSPPDQETYWRLHGAGLVCRREGRIVPSNGVYARFFRSI